jgi:hypothetical protein
VVIVGAAGQTILTTVGMLSGWTNSMVTVSAAFMGPEARVVDDVGKAELAFRLGPVSESLAPGGPVLCGCGQTSLIPGPQHTQATPIQPPPHSAGRSIFRRCRASRPECNPAE